MGKGLLVGGILLGGLAFLWGVFLLGVYALVATRGDASTFLPLPLVAFGAGVTSVAGGVVGRSRLALGSVLVLLAGAAGLLAPGVTLILNFSPGTTFGGVLFAYVAVAWWAIPMAWVGGGVLLWDARRNALKGPAADP